MLDTWDRSAGATPRCSTRCVASRPGPSCALAIENIIKGHLGALIVLGDTSELQFMFSGGMKVDLPFTPQYLYELAKMDGAIMLDAGASRIVHANVQLMPDPTIASAETGTRHRTAERVARQTAALVISISQQRDTVSLFVGEQRYQLEEVADVLAKTNQAVATLETYRQRLDQVVQRLTALEFQGAAMLDDVLVVLQRLELADRVGQEIVQELVELGSDGRLLEMQLSELIGEVPRDRLALVRDYAIGAAAANAEGAVARLAGASVQAGARVREPRRRSSATATPTRRSTRRWRRAGSARSRSCRASATTPRPRSSRASARSSRCCGRR